MAWTVSPMRRAVMRSHYHTYVHEMIEVNGRTAHLVVTPSYCGINDHANQAVRSPMMLGNGMVAFEIVDGEVAKVHALKHTLDIRTKEVIG